MQDESAACCCAALLLLPCYFKIRYELLQLVKNSYIMI